MKFRTTTITLTQRLTQAETAAYGEELARAEREYTEVDEDRTSTAKGYKERLDEITGRIGRLGTVILALDRDEVLKERPLTVDELQGNLPIGEPDAPEDGKSAAAGGA